MKALENYVYLSGGIEERPLEVGGYSLSMRFKKYGACDHCSVKYEAAIIIKSEMPIYEVADQLRRLADMIDPEKEKEKM